MHIAPYSVGSSSYGASQREVAISKRVEFAIPSDVLDRLAPWSTSIQVSARREIVAQGQDATWCYMITSGCARSVRVLEDGRRQVAAFVFPGDLFGWEADGQHEVGAEAITPVRVLRVVSAALDALTLRDPVVGRWLRAVSARQSRDVSERLAVLGCLSAPERIAHFMLAMANRPGIAVGGQIVLPMCRRDIADYLGLTVETISRCLSQYERDAVLAVKSDKIKILNHKALEFAGAGLSD